MIRKVISLFLATQAVSLTLWYGVHAWEDKTTEPTVEPIIVTAEKSIIQDDLKNAPTRTFNHLKFAARDKKRKYFSLDRNRKNEITSVLAKLPPEHISTVRNLILDYNPKAHRGLGGKSLIILRAIDMDKEELFGVLIHEIGHSTDLGYLKEVKRNKISEFKDNKKPIYTTDPSLKFYRISWKNEKTLKKDSDNLDFVSGYGLSDPFEDFAECYVYYVLHNKDFKSKTQTSQQLLKKYNFMKEVVFDGQEFDTGNYLTKGLKKRPWDITVIPYNLDNFING